MLFGCLGVLIAVAGFATEVPPLLTEKLSSTAEVHGTFVQTKTDRCRSYVTKGTYRIRPGVDFEWRTIEPFESVFLATPTNYVYSNEDETITRQLSELPGGDKFGEIGEGNASIFFDLFDALCKEEGGRFFVKAKPKTRDLKRALARVDAEGTVTNWTLQAAFPNGTKFRIDFKDN